MVSRQRRQHARDRPAPPELSAATNLAPAAPPSEPHGALGGDDRGAGDRHPLTRRAARRPCRSQDPRRCPPWGEESRVGGRGGIDRIEAVEVTTLTAGGGQRRRQPRDIGRRPIDGIPVTRLHEQVRRPGSKPPASANPSRGLRSPGAERRRARSDHPPDARAPGALAPRRRRQRVAGQRPLGEDVDEAERHLHGAKSGGCAAAERVGCERGHAGEVPVRSRQAVAEQDSLVNDNVK
jgi:hypothetical protein